MTTNAIAGAAAPVSVKAQDQQSAVSLNVTSS